MTMPDVTTVATHWSGLSEAIHVPHSEAEYRQLVAFLDRLIDELGEEEGHPLASLMELAGVLIEGYENEQVPELTREGTA